MRHHIIYLDKDSLPARRREFLRVADEEAERLSCTPYPAHTGQQLIELGQRAPDGIDHLALICHGSTTGLLRPGNGSGVHTWKSNRPRLVSVGEFANVWAPKLRSGALISLCACLCGRDPAWYLRRLFGFLPKSWGPRSFKSGGKRSFSSRLRDAFLDAGLPVVIRSHTAVGHVTRLPLLREHQGVEGSEGQALFAQCFPNLEPTWPNRRKWIRTVRGELARDWLMGDDTAIQRIMEAWEAK